jgi:hypothetical protein
MWHNIKESKKVSQIKLTLFARTIIIFSLEKAKCETQNSEVNIVQNVIIIQRANTKSSAGQHGPPRNAKVGSGVMKE